MRKRFDMLLSLFDRFGDEHLLCIQLDNYSAACRAGCMVH